MNELTVNIDTEFGTRRANPVDLRFPVTLTRKPLFDAVKRFGDIFCSLCAILVLMPLFVIVILAIVIEDFGNPFYTQTRIGRNGKEFRILKFRSMYQDADERRAELLSQSESEGATFKMEDDPRITKVGKFIRKTSIDELPQLVNILKGDMSVIGPRPFIAEEQALLPADRLLVKPGLSCYWQIGGKNSLTAEQQIALDRKYIIERSAWTDMKIVLKTVLLVLERKNC